MFSTGTLVTDARGKYTDYVIMSGKFRDIAPLLESLMGRVFLLDHFDFELKRAVLGRISRIALTPAFASDTDIWLYLH